jgi:hypothetical protein
MATAERIGAEGASVRVNQLAAAQPCIREGIAVAHIHSTSPVKLIGQVVSQSDRNA